MKNMFVNCWTWNVFVTCSVYFCSVNHKRLAKSIMDKEKAERIIKSSRGSRTFVSRCNISSSFLQCVFWEFCSGTWWYNSVRWCRIGRWRSQLARQGANRHISDTFNCNRQRSMQKSNHTRLWQPLKMQNYYLINVIFHRCLQFRFEINIRILQH